MTEFSFLGELSLLSNWTPVGGAYGEKMSIHQCLGGGVYVEAVFMQTFVPGWHQFAPQIQNELFLEFD